KKLISIQAAQHGNDHDRADDRVAETPEYAIGDGAEDKRISRDFVHWHDVQRNEIQEQIDPHDGEDAAENGARHITPWIAHFFAKVNDAVPAIHRVDDGLNPQHDGDDQRPA